MFQNINLSHRGEGDCGLFVLIQEGLLPLIPAAASV